MTMRTPSQSAIPTCGNPWLFSDELSAEESLLSPFIPRVLNYETSTDLLDHVPRCGDAIVDPSVPVANFGLLLPPLFFDVVPPRGNKRRNRSEVEESCHGRKCPRASDTELARNLISESFETSPILTATSISPVFHSHAPEVTSDHSSCWQKLEVEALKAQNAMLLTKNSQQCTELLESKRCIAFLIDEIRRITYIRNLKQSAKFPCTINDVGPRLEAFVQTSSLLTQTDALQEVIGSCSKGKEDISVLNPLTSNIGWNASQSTVPLAPFERTLCCPSFSCYHNCDLNTSSESIECYSAPEILEKGASGEPSFQSPSTVDNLTSDDQPPDHSHLSSYLRSDQLSLHPSQSLAPILYEEDLDLPQNF